MDKEVKTEFKSKKQEHVLDDCCVGAVTSDGCVEERNCTNGTSVPRKRHRPRTKAYRTHLKNEIDRAICSMDSPLHMDGVLVEEKGVMSALLDDVVNALDLNHHKYASLSRLALSKLGQLSTVFSVQATPGHPLSISAHHPDASSHFDASTVYLDNLPRDCDVVSLYRRAATFGTVVLLHPILERGRSNTSNVCDVQTASTSSQPPSHRVQAAFVQFVSHQSAINFCEAHSKNWPVKVCCKRRKVRKAKRGLGGRRKTVHIETNPQQCHGPRKRKRAFSGHNSDDETPLKKSRSSQLITDGTESKCEAMYNEQHGVVCNEPKACVIPIPGDCVVSAKHRATTASNIRVRRKRVRKRRRTKFKIKHRVGNLSRYLCHMQVLSLQSFRDARAKYLKLKADSFRRLKEELRNESVPQEMGSDSNKSARRNRGRAKLIERVVAFREAHMYVDHSHESSSNTDGEEKCSQVPSDPLH